MPDNDMMTVEEDPNYKVLKQSLAASSRHVFMSWHDVNFVVPSKKTQFENLIQVPVETSFIESASPRVEVIDSHNE